ncbi:hypothetical protein [Croceitalea rosinachiae]|uniref:Lipoprotein n=1 Tax=Croceitalea rosinachiae TaxID=3075596 RepID=A0ABU3AEV1_9FLAO|nr:hypothetical protein [Croceitalea sp. F388]MDT0608057.1 hypothetical protein [Croceitalea sp. F388]
MIKSKFIIYIILSLFLSCRTDPNEQIDEGKIENEVYHSPEIGWTMKIPKGWNVTHRNVLDKRNKIGLDAINESVDADYDINGLKQLLNLQKDQFNGFQSSSEPFELEYEGEWEENNAALKELVYGTYLHKGIKTDSTETKIVEIDELKFHKYQFTIYDPKGNVILNQLMYSRLINGLDFGININYNNESDKNELLKAWKNSKFKK